MIASDIYYNIIYAKKILYLDKKNPDIRPSPAARYTMLHIQQNICTCNMLHIQHVALAPIILHMQHATIAVFILYLQYIVYAV